MAKHSMPARGAMAGLKQDLAKAKDPETGFAPNGTGAAWSHNFLNQANFRNQARVYEAEQKRIQEEKQRELAKAEFQAEQEFLKTISYLSPAEQERQRERQGVQFLYMKPPGADSLPAPAAPPAKEQGGAAQSGGGADAAAAAAAVAADLRDGGAAPGPQQPPGGGSSRPSYLGNMLGAVRALRDHEKWEVRHVAGIGRSPPRGQVDPGAENQRILVTDSDEEPPRPEPEEEARRRKRRRGSKEKDRLAEAEAVLREAGFDVEQIRAAAAAGGGASERRKGGRGHKKEKKRRRERSP